MVFLVYLKKKEKGKEERKKERKVLLNRPFYEIPRWLVHKNHGYRRHYAQGGT